MPSMKRRHFLQAAGSSLAAIGLSQTGFLRQANHYGKALAQGTPRKLALLVGVNQYPDPAVSDLYGCLNDVNMQYELLKHRFGFKEADILRVTDNSGILPTRANILQAFEEHLIQQAKPGDIVVFHYSGHGSLVKDENAIRIEQCGDTNVENRNGTLVPRDAEFPSRAGQSEIVVPDIMGRSLFLLTERIKTNNVTLVLDSCFSGAGTRGNATVRSATSSRLSTRSGLTLVPSSAELEQQKQWMTDLKIDETEFHRRRAQGIAKGVALGSASCNQEAFEIPFDNGEKSGIFTYLLTSYLWQVPAAEAASTTQVNLARSTRITAATQSRFDQVPIFETAPGSNSLSEPLYFTSSLAPFADAVVTNLPGSQIEFWLGGLSPQTLETVRKGTVYSLLDAAGNPQADVEVEWRNGLFAYGKLAEGQTANIEPGLLLREKVAALAVPSLRIGVDPSLSAERVAAEAALGTALGTTSTTSGQAISRITVLPVDQQSAVEFVLARTSETMQADLRTAGSDSLAPIGSIGLYSADLSMLVPNTTGFVNESALAAVNRLRPRFRALLVARALQQLAGTPTSLRVGGEIFSTSGQGPTVPIAGRAAQSNLSRLRPEVTAAIYQSGDVIQLRIKNEEATDVYLSCLVISTELPAVARR
ncbi:MAG: caspase family protein, partial [Nodosilinea sp.]